MLAVIAFVAVMGLTADAPPMSHADCPMAAVHHGRAGVDARHDQAVGVGHEGLVHHFLLEKDGGAIRLDMKDAGRKDAREDVRRHLQAIAKAFAAGDFGVPASIHAQVPPGVEVMKERKGVIRYAYAPTDRGGQVRITTADPRAREAIHAFLRFQIEDHGTGDPTE
jgi:hypothetical protein